LIKERTEQDGLRRRKDDLSNQELNTQIEANSEWVRALEASGASPDVCLRLIDSVYEGRIRDELKDLVRDGRVPIRVLCDRLIEIGNNRVGATVFSKTVTLLNLHKLRNLQYEITARVDSGGDVVWFKVEQKEVITL
jgi:hypothetical protein